MLIVDSQLHIWKPNSPERPWTPGVKPQLPEPFTIEDAIAEMDAAGVHRALIVPPGWEFFRNDYATEAFDKHPDRFRFLARIGLEREGARSLLPDWMKQRGNLGMRHVFMAQFDRDQVASGAYDWMWADCEKYNIPVSILPIGLRPKLEQILDRHPRLKLTIDHMGLSEPLFKEGRVAETIEDTLALARFPNCSVKVSSVPTNSREKYPYRDMHRHVHRIVDAFGPKRCFWGSDLTHMRHAGLNPCSLRECVTVFTEELGFSASDLEWIMGRALCEHFGWPLPN